MIPWICNKLLGSREDIVCSVVFMKDMSPIGKDSQDEDILYQT